MAVAGDMHNIPCFLISLGKDSRVQVHSWPTNKPREYVERDIDRAVDRLLAGDRFQMWCSGPQVMRINERLEERCKQTAIS